MGAHTSFRIGAILAALGVALGAFAAHGLKASVEPAMLANFETGVRYQMYAALAIMAMSAFGAQRRATIALLTGAIIFSGTLYLMVATGMRWVGAITPIGGVFLIGGLALAALDARTQRKEQPDGFAERIR